MIELDRKIIVSNLLHEKVLASKDVCRFFHLQNTNRAEALEKFKRWKDRTYKVLIKYVNSKEAEGFWNLSTKMIYYFPTNQYAFNSANEQISAHVEYIKSVVENIEENYIFLNKDIIIKWTYYVFLYLKNAKDDKKPYTKIQSLADKLSIPIYELKLYLEQLLLLKMINVYGDYDTISITDNGSKEFTLCLEKSNRDKKDKILEDEKMAEKNYAENELLVLKTIYDLGKNLPMGAVMVSDIAKKLRMPYSELNEYLNELEERKGLIENFSDEAVKVAPKGKEFLQGKSNLPGNITSGHTYNTNIYAPSNNQIGGQGNVQNAQIILHPEFDNAIKSITNLIKESSLTQFKQADLISNIEHIKQLQSSEPSVELVEHAKSKVDYLGIAVKGTDLAVKIAPYLPALYAYFESLIKSAN